MPEGHTLHRIARDHHRWFAGQSLAVSSPQGRFAEQSQELDGRQLKRVEAFGKHLIYHWAGGKLLHVHLGLYGKFRVQRKPAKDPRGAVRVRMIGQTRLFDLNGPNTCELLTPSQLDALVQRLGPDPLREDADPLRAWQRIDGSRAPIGTLLMDQSVLAGIGNIYRTEILFRLGIHPRRTGRQLGRPAFDQIWQLAQRWLTIGVRYNRIITVDIPTGGKPPSRLNASERTRLYQREDCPECGGAVEQFLLASRKVFACPHCQT